MKNFGLSALGGGVGLRHEHFEEILAAQPACNWFEIISDDFMDFGGYSRDRLMQIRERYQIISHGVCMAIGSTDPLDREYLQRLKRFCREIGSPWTSDHLCFTKVDHTNMLDLMPLPFTEETVRHVVERVKTVQGELEIPFLLENITRYVTVSDREMSEAQFISDIVTRADCGLLLDVTNVFLNSKFHGYDAWQFIESLPLERVGQIHLAGWEPAADGSVIGSHDGPVQPEVWELFKRVISRTGPTSVLVEWDNLLPPFARLLDEAALADKEISEYARQAKG